MPEDKNGRKHCYLCGHFIPDYINRGACTDCQNKHDDEVNSGVKVCTCGRMFAGWTYDQRRNDLRHAGTESAFQEHWHDLNKEGINHDWLFVKHGDLTNAEILSGKVIVEGRFP